MLLKIDSACQMGEKHAVAERDVRSAAQSAAEKLTTHMQHLEQFGALVRGRLVITIKNNNK